MALFKAYAGSIYGYRRTLIFSLQFVLSLLAAFYAFALRFDFNIPLDQHRNLLTFVAVALVIKLTIYHVFNLNRGWWRFISLSDMMVIFKAVTLAQAFVVFAVFNIPFVDGFPRSVIIVDYLLTLMLLGGVRLFARICYERQIKGRQEVGKKKVLIVGAGGAGMRILRGLQQNYVPDTRVVGLIDDDPVKQKMSFHGISTLGTVDDIARICRLHYIDEIFIAIPSIKKAGLQRIVDRCLEAKVPFKMIPSLAEILEYGMSIYQLREVKVEDLLGREPVRLDKSKICAELNHKVVLVTGAGGSIGSELCRQILGFNPKRLILLERSEENLFYIERELRERFPKQQIAPVIGDILNAATLERIFSQHLPEVIYHAAAYKHVPLMEENPREAIRNNVFGTRNVAEMANRFSARKFVLISTDKAVNPINVMGYTKRLAELVVQNCANNGVEFISVRFGNVIGSSGSVVEIFQRQIQAGQPLTVTDPETTRFFMTTPEAVELVLHAGAHGTSGQVYMLDMGKPVKIIDLARKMIQLADPKSLKGLQITITGMRSGEKLTEELVWEGEDFVPSPVEKVFILKHRVLTDEIPNQLSQLKQILEMPNVDLFAKLKSVVDEIDNGVRRTHSTEKTAVSNVVPFPSARRSQSEISI